MSSPGEPLQRALLVGWDGATWDLLNPLLDRNELPNLHRLVESGVMGTLRTRWPLIAPVVFNSVATGKYANKHCVLGQREVSADGAISPTGSNSRRAKAFWEILSQNDRSSLVINFPTTGPAEDIAGAFVAPRFFQMHPDGSGDVSAGRQRTVDPDALVDTLSPLNVSLAEINAQTMSAFVPRFRELETADPRLIKIGTALARALSVQAVATSLMERERWQLTSVNFSMIDTLGEAFLKHQSSPGDGEASSEVESFDLVVDAAIKACDLLLGRLVELAGEDTAVLLYSPWGPRTSPNVSRKYARGGRPDPELKHRGEGIFVLRAPGIPPDELVHDVGFLDICPTVLRLCGITIGEDMDGRAIHELFTKDVGATYRIASWETEGPQRPGTKDPVQAMPVPLSMEFTEAFQAKPARRIQADNLWTLGRVQLAAGRNEAVVPLLLKLYHASPLDIERGPMVASALYWAGYVSEAIQIMTPLSEAFSDSAVGKFMAGVLQLHRGKTAGALALLEQAGADDPPFPRLFYLLGHIYLSLDQRDQAIDAYRRALELDPDFSSSYLGLSEALLRSGRAEEAAEVALSVLGFAFSDPAAHLALGRALVRLGEASRAREAYGTALRLDSNNDVARQHLELLDRQPRKANSQESAVEPPQLTPPMILKHQARPSSRAAVQQALLDITSWRNKYMDDFELAEGALDDYLEKNVFGDHGQTMGLPEPTAKLGGLLGKIREENWIVRPIEPGDQPTLARMFQNPFSNPGNAEILVTHPAGSRGIHGGVLLTQADPRRGICALEISTGEEPIDRDMQVTGHSVFLWVLRAGVLRAAAAGARRLIVSLPADQSEKHLASLSGHGFQRKRIRQKYRMEATALRDRCLGLVERLRGRGKIPGNVRVESLENLPWPQAEAFLKKYFVGPLDVLGEEYSPHLSWMLLAGNEIIAGGIGTRVDENTVHASRVAVDEKHRSTWTSPMVLGYLAKFSCDDGLRYITYLIDADRRPEWAQISRHLEAELIETYHEYWMELAEPYRPLDRDAKGN